MRSTQDGDGGEDVEAVALEDFDVVLGVVEDGGGEAGPRASGRWLLALRERGGLGQGFGGAMIKWDR